MDAALFYICAGMTLTGGILTVTLRNPIHCAVSLILSLLGVAGLFLLQTAEFLFAAQILLYVGGVMVLFLFVIMLIHLDEAAKLRQYSRQWPVALVALLFVVIEFLVFLNAGIVNLPNYTGRRFYRGLHKTSDLRVRIAPLANAVASGSPSRTRPTRSGDNQARWIRLLT